MPNDTFTFEEATEPTTFSWEDVAPETLAEALRGQKSRLGLEQEAADLEPVAPEPPPERDITVTGYAGLNPLPPITEAQLTGAPEQPGLLRRGMVAFDSAVNNLLRPTGALPPQAIPHPAYGPTEPTVLPPPVNRVNELANRQRLKEQIQRVESPTVGLRESLVRGTEAVTSPSGLVIAGAATVAPQIVGPAIFATTAAEIPGQIERIQKAREEQDRPGYYSAVGDLLQSAFILAFTGMDAFKRQPGTELGRPLEPFSVDPSVADRVAAAIAEARANGPSPEFRSLFGGIDPEIAGTTPEKVSAFAESLGMEWKPVPKAGPEEPTAEPFAPTTPTPKPKGPAPTRPAAPAATTPIQELRMEGVTQADAEALLNGTKTVKEVVSGNFKVTPTWTIAPDAQGHAEAWMAGYDQAIDRLTDILDRAGVKPTPETPKPPFRPQPTAPAIPPRLPGQPVPPEQPKPTPEGIDPEITDILNSDASPQMKAGNLRALASTRGVPIKDIQEAVEVHVVRAADTIARDPALDPFAKFTKLLDLYNRQPVLSARTSTSVELQAYSTPAPLAYAMSYATGVTPESSVYDATAGNGMLLIGSDASVGHANELNPARLANLNKSGIGTVTPHDATKYTPGTTFPIIHLNPPFGSIPNVNYNGYGITRLEHLISLKALEALNDDGVGMMILGAALHERPGGKGAQWVFENYLYGHYNVVANFEVAGDLYAKQGAKWPVRVIVVAGRKQLPETGVFAPETVARLNNWGDVWKEAERVRREIESRRSGVVPGSPPSVPLPVKTGPATTGQPGKVSAPSGRPFGAIAGAGGTGGGAGGKPPIGARPPVGGVGSTAGRPSDEPTNAELPVSKPHGTGKPTAPVEGGLPIPEKPAANVPAEGAGTGGATVPGELSKPSTVERPAGDLAGMSESELDNLLDEASGKPPPTVAPAPAPAPTEAPTKSAGQISADAAKLGVQGADAAMKGLHDLFGGGTHVGIGPSFDEGTYAKAKPHFKEAYDKFKAAGKTLKEFFQFIFQKFGERIREYLKRFMQELQGKPKPQEPPKTPPKVEATELQVPYEPFSEAGAFGTLIPKSIAEGVKRALRKLVAKVGPIDAFVADRLNIDVDQLKSVMAAEQIDGVAQALDQMDVGGALIIGHETGIGKGRIGAGVIRSAIVNGQIPMFFTKDPKLFTDMNGDLLDIGTAIHPFILGDPGKASIVDAQGNVIHRSPGPTVQKREMQRILQVGLQAAGYDSIFVTYSQINVRNERQQFLEQLAANNPTVVILDEAHEAAGDADESMQAAFMIGGDVVRGSGANRTTISVPGLLRASGTLQGQGGVLYMSATFAKRPENMVVYSRTDLSKGAQSIDQVVDAMKRGGVALQQAISEALAEAGQYTRVERDFTGIKFDVVPIDVSDPVKLTEDVDAVTDVLAEIVRFSAAMKARVKASTAQTETQLAMTEFASVVHNQISQLLLAVKADHVVDMAIAAHKRGEKPLISLMNTMEAFLDGYIADRNIKPGNRVQIRWNELLQYALSRTLRVTEKLPNGDRVIHTINPDDYGLGEFYRSIQRMADGIDIKFPVSPIDYIIQKLGKAGVKMAELTGRESGIEYTNFDTGEGIYRNFPKANKNRVVNGFNNGDYNGMLLNASGSTGLSAHASVKFKDQKPRHMMIAQPALDINVFIQTLGRIKRTGMVSLGVYPGGGKYGARYSYPTLPLQAEIRPAAMASRKMKSLNANITAEATGAVKIEAEDIYNRYGDLTVSEYLGTNPEVADLMGLHVEYNDDGSIKVQRDVAKKFTGRLALLPDSEQVKAYDEILPAYRNLIEQLKSTGEYDLEIVVHDDWAAVRQSDEQLAPATDPSSMFTAGVRMQRWEISDKRHVPTGDEMRAEFQKNLGTREQVLKKWDDLEAKFDAELVRREGVLNDKMAGATAEEQARITRQLTSLREQRDRWDTTKGWVGNIMDNVGRVIELRNTDSGEIYHGLITNMSLPKTFNFAPSAFRFRFTVDDPTGSVYLTGGDIGFNKWELYLSDQGLSDFKGAHGPQRATRYVITGNPIQGITATGGKGKMVRFRTAQGDIITGLLMPRNWGPNQLAHDPRVELVSGQAVSNLLMQHGADIRVETFGGIVRIGRDNRGRYLISVPKSKRSGGLVFLDQPLRAITGDFTSSQSRMLATIDQSQLAPAAQRIMDILKAKFRAIKRPDYTGDEASIIARVSGANAVAMGTGLGTAAAQQRAQQQRGETGAILPAGSEGKRPGMFAGAPRGGGMFNPEHPEMPPTVEDVRRQRLLNEEGPPVPPDPNTPTPPPTGPPEATTELNDETEIVDAARRKDVLPARDWIASPEWEFRKNPVGAGLVTQAVEAELSYQAEAGRDYERFKEMQKGLGKQEQIRITKALRAAMEGDTTLLDALPTHQRAVATQIREYFDELRRIIIEGKQRDLIDSLPEARAAAVHDILGGMDPADAYRAHRLREAGRRAVQDALRELDELENWGLEDYITNVERGSYRVVGPDGTTVAVAETRVGAKEKALQYAREHPGTTKLTITDEFASGASFPTKLTRGQYYRMAQRAANALGTDVAEIQRMLRAEGSPIVVIKPPSKFAAPLQKRRGILKGEDNIFDALPGYAYSVRKKLALDPVFKQVRNNLGKLPPNMQKQVEELMTDIRGRYHIVDQIVDYLLSSRLGRKPFAYSRGVGQARKVAAILKLGYRPVAALVNRLGGLQHTWVKTGNKYLIQGRQFLKTPEFRELWKENADYVGANALAFLEGGGTGTEPFYKPLGLFQAAEKVNRPEAFASFYKYAEGELGLHGEAAAAFARKAVRFGQFTYTIGSLPRLLRSPTGRLVGQFKPYLLKEMEFVFSLRGWEWPRYIGAFLAMGGPRALLYFLRSLPILGAIGALWWLEDWLNRKAPRASRGLPGYAGVDISPSVTPQLPSTATDWLGPTLGDIYKLWDQVIRPVFQNEGGELRNFTTWASRIAPAYMYFSRMIESLTKKGQVTDERGRPQYKPDVAGKIKMGLGAKPLDQSVSEVDRAYMDHVNAIQKKQREDVVDHLIDAINRGDGVSLNKWLKPAIELGIDESVVMNAAQQREREPQERLFRRLLKSVRVENAERLANPPKP